MECLALFGLDWQVVNGFLEAGGYIVLFGLLLACGMGLPLPEDIPLIIAGALIAKGQMQWVHAGIVAWCGIIGGDLILYYLGHRFGRNITRVPFVGKHLSEKRIDQAEKLFEKWGVLVVAVGRMFAGIRGAMVVTAGTIRYPLPRFIIADGLAALVSGGFFMVLGFLFYKHLDDIFATVAKYKELVILGLGVVVIIAGGIWWWRRKRRMARLAAAELAGAPVPGNDSSEMNAGEQGEQKSL